MRHSTHPQPLLQILMLVCILASALVPQTAPPVLAAEANPIITETAIDGFELYFDRIFYWQNGSCGTRAIDGFVRRQMLGFDATATRADVHSPDCSVAPSVRPAVVRDEYFFYYFIGEQLAHTLAADGGPVMLSSAPPVSSRAGLTIDGRDIYWSSYNAGTNLSTIWRMPVDGGELPLSITVASGEIVWLRSLLASNGAADERVLVWRTVNGTLGRWRPTPGPFGSTITLGSGPFIDQSIALVGSTGANEEHTYIYAVHTDQLRRIDLFNGQDTPLYTPPNGWELRAVVADGSKASGQERRIFISERPIACAGTACINQGRIKRHPLVSSNWTQASWELLSDETTGGGGINLRSSSNQLYLLRPGAPSSIVRLDADAAPLYTNIKALGFEVVQAIQNMAGDVPLIAERETYVRGYATLSPGSDIETAFTTARLDRVAPDGQTVIASIWAVNQPPIEIGKPLSDLRADATRSFLFILPNSWVNQPGSSFEVRMRMVVNPDGDVIESAGSLTDNSVGQPKPITFVRVPSVCLVTYPVLAAGAPLPPVDGPLIDEALARARSLLPVVAFQHTPRLLPLTDGGDPYDFSDDGEDSSAMAQLQWEAATSDPPPNCDLTFYTGVVHKNAPWAWAGLAWKYSNVSLFKLSSSGSPPYNAPSGGVALAHELGHDFGRKHVMCGSGFDPDSDFDLSYPYPVCQISGSTDLDNSSSHVGFDPLSYFADEDEDAVILPFLASDVMSYGSQKWPSPYFWNKLLSAQPIGLSAPLASAEAQRSSTPQLAIQGVMSAYSGRITRMAVLPSAATPLATRMPPGTRRDDYWFALLDVRGDLLARHQIALSEAHNHGSRPDRFRFMEVLDWPDGVVRVELRHGDRVLDARRVSATAPIVSLGAPELDTALGTVSLSWSASDSDGDQLAATVQYSPDGQHWQTLAAGLLDSKFVLARSEIPSGSAQVRVLLSDGALVTVSASQPLVGVNQPPTVTISGLSPWAQLHFGSKVKLFGSSYDPEDGLLLNQEWQLSGPTSASASGFEYAPENLLPGDYTLRLRAVDHNGLVGEATLEFTILTPVVPTHATPSVFTLDGICTAAEYTNALDISVPHLQGGPPARALLIRSPGSLLDAVYVCLLGQQYASQNTITRHAGLRFDLNLSRETQAQPDDIGFLARDDGELAEIAGSGAGAMPQLQIPLSGFNARTKRSGAVWSAELQIPVSLFGGWDKPVGLMFSSDANATTDGGLAWPPGANPSNPSSWARVHLGTVFLVGEVNPYAVVVGSQVERPASPRKIYLDGSASGDPLGRAVNYQWTQVAGPPVTLTGAKTVMASFTADPVSAPTELRFELRASRASSAIQVGESAGATIADTRVLLLPPIRVTERISLPHDRFLPSVVR